MDDASGIVYYHHTKTGDVQWEIPAGVTPRVQQPAAPTDTSRTTATTATTATTDTAIKSFAARLEATMTSCNKAEQKWRGATFQLCHCERCRTDGNGRRVAGFSSNINACKVCACHTQQTNRYTSRFSVNGFSVNVIHIYTSQIKKCVIY